MSGGAYHPLQPCAGDGSGQICIHTGQPGVLVRRVYVGRYMAHAVESEEDDEQGHQEIDVFYQYALRGFLPHVRRRQDGGHYRAVAKRNLSRIGYFVKIQEGEDEKEKQENYR